METTGPDLSADPVSESRQNFIRIRLEREQDRLEFRRWAFIIAMAVAFVTWFGGIAVAHILMSVGPVTPPGVALAAIMFSVAVAILVSLVRAVFLWDRRLAPDGNEGSELGSLPKSVVNHAADAVLGK